MPKTPVPTHLAHLEIVWKNLGHSGTYFDRCHEERAKPITDYLLGTGWESKPSRYSSYSLPGGSEEDKAYRRLNGSWKDPLGGYWVSSKKAFTAQWRRDTGKHQKADPKLCRKYLKELRTALQSDDRGLCMDLLEKADKALGRSLAT
jgi:hypothetical protein